MTESRRSRTRTLPPNDQKTGNQPDTTGQEAPTEAEVVAGVTHYHGGERDFHRHGLDPHHHIDGRLVDGAWAPDGVKLWEYVGIADVNEHRHDDRHTHSHDPFGQQEHFHNPANNAVLPLPVDGWPVEYQPRQEPAEPQATGSGTAHLPAPNPPVEVTPGTTYTAEVKASQARHPSGRDTADPYQQGFQAGEQATRQELANGDNTDPVAIQRSKEAARAASARLADVPAPQPPPARVVPATANPAVGRLGADLGGLELVKASFRALFPGAPDGLDQEWALTMGASDLIGQMLNQHRQPAFADPGLIAGLRALAEQLDEVTAAREARP